MNTQETVGGHQGLTTAPRRTDFSIEFLLKKEPEERKLTLVTKNDKILSPEDEDEETRIQFLGKPGRGYESDQESSLSTSSPEPMHPILGGNDHHRFLGLTEDDLSTFSWLSCTRFKPPKLPRSRKRVGCKRYGRGPRIPFAPQQIAVLESTFSKSQYLSSDCIHSLADTLHLSETRVKIWFQNRRARYRREKEAALAQNNGDEPQFHHDPHAHHHHPSSLQQYQHSDDPGGKQPMDLGRTMNKLAYAHFMKTGGPSPEDLSNQKLPVVPDFLAQQLQHYRQVQEYIFQQEQMRRGGNPESTSHSSGNYSAPQLKQLSPASPSILQSVLQSFSTTPTLFPGIPFQPKGFPTSESESQANSAAVSAATIDSSSSHRFNQSNHSYPPPPPLHPFSLQFR